MFGLNFVVSTQDSRFTTGKRMPKPPQTDLVDAFGRRHNYLRISITDRCNLRCTYCMPAEGIERKPHEEILRYHEIVRVARVLAGMGVGKIRLTGGEPLVRRNAPGLVRELAQIPGIDTLAMTTNGVLLGQFVGELKSAGLHRLNVSLDTLRPERFARLTRRNDLQSVRHGIDAALEAGFIPLRLNAVVMRGFNDDEVGDFVELARNNPIHVCFIEYMPFHGNQWERERLVSHCEILERVSAHYPVQPLECEDLSRPVKEFSIEGFRGRIGIIASMTQPFCETCSRLRLTSEGALKTCLFHHPETSLRDQMRAGCSDEELAKQIRSAVLLKPQGHPGADELQARPNRSMVQIGG